MKRFAYWILPIFLAVLLLPVSRAGAATGGVTATGDFGPWYPSPGSFSTQGANAEDPSLYQANIQPLSDNSVAEIANFSCTYPTPNSGPGTPRGAYPDKFHVGQIIGTYQQSILGDIFDDANAAYAGTLTTSDGVKWSGSGTGAMDSFLAWEYNALKVGGWQSYSQNPELYKNTGNFSFAVYQDVTDQIDAKQAQANAVGGQISALNSQIRQAYLSGNKSLYKTDKAKLGPLNSQYDGLYTDIGNLKASIAGLYGPDPNTASLINYNAANPFQASEFVPQGCGLNPIQGVTVHFLDLINNPGKFFTDLLLWIPTNAEQQLYDFLQPYAFIYTFWTPHTERGDTIFNVATGCAPTYYSAQDAPSPGYIGQQSNAQEIANSCANGQPLGFNKQNNTDSPNWSSNPWYISMAIFFQWFISGFYFIILFAAAILYMVRGNRNTQLNVLHLIPKLLAAVLLTMFSSFLIGALITFSNLMVTTLFSYGDQKSVGYITNILSASSDYITAAGSLVSQIIQVVVGGFVIFFFAIFILGTLLRQIALIALIIFAPLAIFCLIVPRWAHNFGRYVRILMAIIFAPPIMAFILKLGMSINPIVNQSGQVSDLTGFLGLLILVATLWAMAKALKLSFAVATGSQAFNKSLVGRGLGRISEAAGLAAVATGPAGGLVFGALSRTAGAGARIGSASESLGASLVPQSKQIFGTSSGSGGFLRSGTQRKLLGRGSDRQGSGSEDSKQPIGQRYQEFLNQRLAKRGESRISGRAAKAMETERTGAMEAKERELGHRLSRRERDEFLRGSFVRDKDGRIIIDQATGHLKRNNDGWYAAHGEVVKRNGNYLLVQPEEVPKRPPGVMGRVAGKVKDISQTRIPIPALDKIDDAREQAKTSVRRQASRVRTGRAPTRVGNPEGDNAASVHKYMQETASDPSAQYGSPEMRRAAAEHAASFAVCSRCGGPLRDGKCPNPACRPVQERRRRRGRGKESGTEYDNLANVLRDGLT